MGGIFSIQVGDELTGRCWDCCGAQAAYMCRIEANLGDLQTTTRELKALKEDVVRRVRVQEQQRMKRLAQVDAWFSSVDPAIAAADELIADRGQHVHRLCLGGYCSKNCWSSYTFGKKVAETSQMLVSLKDKGQKFELIAEKGPAEEDLVPEMPCDPTVGLEKKLKEVWSCLSEEDVKIVGLYGIGGVGKTTLLTQIHNKFVGTSNSFLVIWVVVSQNVTLERLQAYIGKKIGFSDEHWKDKSLDEKAQEVFNKLQKIKFVLLLDDIWQRVDLKKIGVPPPGKLNGSKVIFTTRSMDVCYQMGAEKRIEVGLLEWEQAWELFEKNVGEETINFHPEIRLLAESVAKKCGGLPLALITIGRSMSGKKGPQEWHHATKLLRTPALQLREVEDEVLSLLKFSYDSLPSDKIRFCFLYCALFPDDYIIDKTELIDYWICEDFWIDCDNRIDACNEGYSIIGTLIRASLLEEEKVERRECVKMHDVIRDVALWITKENTLVMAGRELKEAPRVKRWEGLRRLSLMQNDIEELTEVPKCPDLVTLLLHYNWPLYEISNDFFQFMSSLTVLDLSRTGLKELPRGISKLVSLQYLNIGETAVLELPIELTELRKLKYLNLEWLHLKGRKSEQLISKLLSLQVLRMLECRYSYEGKGDEEANEGMLLQELQHLKDLNALSISIRCSSTLHKFVISDNLSSNTEYLRLEVLKGLEQVNISSLANIKNMISLDVKRCGLRELHIDRFEEGIGAVVALKDIGFYSLVRVTLYRCDFLQELTWLILVPNLKILTVYYCCGLEEIISDEKLGKVTWMPQNLHPFSRLEFLGLSRLPKLKCIYQKPLLFTFLNGFEVFTCPELKKLPVDRNSGKGCKIELMADKRWWKSIEWEDEATKAAFLPRLKYNLF